MWYNAPMFVDPKTSGTEGGDTPLLSVIVPVYRTPEPLLRAALDSILAGEVKDLELICVDDCPGGESSPVLAEYQARDPRVRLLVNDRNRGVSHSRNRGLAAARGAWLAFQDSDDRVTPDGYARLIAFAQEHGLDAARGGAAKGKFAKNNETWIVASTADEGEAIVRITEQFTWAVWGAVYRRASLEGLAFPEGVNRYEDSAFIAALLLAPRRVGYLDVPVYLYVQHGDSLSRRETAEWEYVMYAMVAQQIARMMRQAHGTVATGLLRHYARKCLHILFSDRRGFERVQGRRQRKAFCAGAREVAWVIAPYVAWHLRWTLRLVALWPRMLFWPGRVAWNLIKLEAGRTFP